jgi:hypothetical protein
VEVASAGGVEPVDEQHGPQRESDREDGGAATEGPADGVLGVGGGDPSVLGSRGGDCRRRPLLARPRSCDGDTRSKKLISGGSLQYLNGTDCTAS